MECVFDVSLSRAAGALGLAVNLNDSRVVRVQRGSVADKGGIRKFDRIAALNERNLTGQLGAAIAAEGGSSVTLTVERRR